MRKNVEKLILNLPAAISTKRGRWGLLLAGGLGLAVLWLAANLFAPARGLTGRYYATLDWSGTPFLTVRDQAIDLHRMRKEFPARTTNYSIRWAGAMQIRVAGVYEFATASDDGSDLYLDDRLVVDDGGMHGLQERSAAVRLTKGFHALRIDYFQASGAAGLVVYWKKPGGTRENIATAPLWPAKPGIAQVLLTAAIAAVIGIARFSAIAGMLTVALLFAADGRNVYRLLRSVAGALGGAAGAAWLLLPQMGVSLETLPDEIVSWLICVAAAGVYAGISHKIKAIQRGLQYGLLIGGSFFFMLGCGELLLRTGWFDDWGTIWIQDQYRQIDYAINKQNWEFAKQNPYGFTDLVRNEAKPAGVYRIAVLGDSFVWGDALLYEKAWGHKLDRKITGKYPHIEVLNWGANGWSTANEIAFLKTHGVQYDIDLLIVGFVRNDPDFGNYPWQLFDVKTLPQWYVRAVFYPVRKLFPNVFELSADYFNEFLMGFVLDRYGYGWNAWHEKLYAAENLQRYGALLKDLGAYCQAHNMRLLFVLTPASCNPVEEKRLRAVAELLRQAQIDYLNLFPAVVRDLSRYRPRQLWANLADPHPGPLMTELFANETLQYLEQQGLLAGHK